MGPNRQQVLTYGEYVATQNRAIEAMMRERIDLLRQHDAAFRCERV